ncbi:ATP-binding protein [Luteolibacter sp. SL250]|uniref:ATP-binding protein n=1 Tax=Luteolibacter sp. SL250 TaxID=2995170 RepID=UPI00226E1901|nr:ATP-binding protein [Luteolibacter sp. SL250]WAC19739.1 ATP-binding protein [Luteolibacter sp. SL250]
MTSIRRRLSLPLGIAIALLFLFAGAGVTISMRHALHSRLDDSLDARARTLAAAAEIDDDEFEFDSSVKDLVDFRKGRDYYAVRRLSGGTPVETSDAAAEIGTLPSPGEDAPLSVDSTLDGKPARFHLLRFTPKDDDERRFRDLYLVIGTPTADLDAQLGLLRAIMLGAGALAILATVVIVGYAVRGGLKPLAALTDELATLQPDQLGRRLETSRLPTELKPVGHSLNEWLQRLEASFERERRFSSHAAHELRTPLAELRAMAELGAMFPDEATPERFHEVLAVSDELSSLLERLSLLSRTEAGRQPVSNEPVDLRAAVDLAVERVSRQAEERGIRFTAAVDGAPFTSDPVLWATILQNLIGNAAAHSPVGSGVEITAGPGNVTVSNPAPDLTQADVDLLFERFWRKDAAHSGTEHSGLGLSIVQATAKALGGECSAELSAGGVLTISVSM